MTTDLQTHSDVQRACQDDDVAGLLQRVKPTAGGHVLSLSVDREIMQMLATQADRVIVSDLSSRAGGTIERDLPNVRQVEGFAEALPWHDHTFDLVCSVDSAHRLAEVDRFLEEAARVLKPGGSLIVYERLLPENERAARYVEAFYRLSDPDHNRAFAAYQWQGMCLNAGLVVAHVDVCRKRTRLLAWAQVHGCTADVIERLQILLAQAPQAASGFLHPSCAATPDAEFDQYDLALVARKP